MAVFFDNEEHLRVVGLATKEQPLEFFDKDTELTRELLQKIHNYELSQE